MHATRSGIAEVRIWAVGGAGPVGDSVTHKDLRDRLVNLFHFHFPGRMTSQFVDQVALIKDEVNLAPVWIAGASVLFGITRLALSGIVPSKVVTQGAVSTWKWKNIANSLLHSVITGSGAIVRYKTLLTWQFSLVVFWH